MIDKMKDVAAQLALAPGTRVELTPFPGGAAVLDVWRSGRLFVMQYSQTRRFEVDEVRDGEGFLLGTGYASDDFETAAERLKALVAAAGGSEATAPTSAAAPLPVLPASDQTEVG